MKPVSFDECVAIGTKALSIIKTGGPDAPAEMLAAMRSFGAANARFAICQGIFVPNGLRLASFSEHCMDNDRRDILLAVINAGPEFDQGAVMSSLDRSKWSDELSGKKRNGVTCSLVRLCAYSAVGDVNAWMDLAIQVDPTHSDITEILAGANPDGTEVLRSGLSRWEARQNEKLISERIDTIMSRLGAIDAVAAAPSRRRMRVL